jgi:hypothetical protein
MFRGVADGQGFEPWLPFGKHAFQACALDHSATHPIGAKLKAATGGTVVEWQLQANVKFAEIVAFALDFRVAGHEMLALVVRKRIRILLLPPAFDHIAKHRPVGLSV